MYYLKQFTLKDMIECDLQIRSMEENSTSMEEVANKIVNYLYENLIDQVTGEKANVLIRFFKIHPFGELEEHLQKYIARKYPQYTLNQHLKCLTLLASSGKKENWYSCFN